MTASEYGDKDSYILREQLFEDFMRKGGKKMADQHQLNQGNVITDPSVFNNSGDGGFSFNRKREDMNNTFNNNQGSAKNPENIINAGSNIRTNTNIVENAVTPPPTNKDGDQGGDNVVQGGNSNQTPSAKEVNDSNSSSNVQVQMPKALQELGMPKYASRNAWNEMFDKIAGSENSNKQSNDVVGDSAVTSSGDGGNNGTDNEKALPSGGANTGVGVGDVAKNTNNKNDQNSDPYEVKEMTEYTGTIADKGEAIKDKFNDKFRENKEAIDARKAKGVDSNQIKNEVAGAFGSGAVGLVNKLSGGDKTFQQIEEEEKKQKAQQKLTSSKDSTSSADSSTTGKSSSSLEQNKISPKNKTSSSATEKPKSLEPKGGDSQKDSLERKLSPDHGNQNQNKKNKK